MQFINIITLLAPFLAVSVDGTRFTFHSLNHCNHSPVDRSCSHIKPGHCCYNPGGGIAQSINFAGAKGRVAHATKNHCKTDVYTYKVHTKNSCAFNLHASSAFFVNPLTAGEDDTTTCCSALVEPDQAIVYGNTAFDTASMSTEQFDELNALAANGTAIAEWPTDLTAFIVPEDDNDVDELESVDAGGAGA